MHTPSHLFPPEPPSSTSPITQEEDGGSGFINLALALPPVSSSQITSQHPLCWCQRWWERLTTAIKVLRKIFCGCCKLHPGEQSEPGRER